MKPTMKENFGLGPRTGNSSRAGKRQAFQAGKDERNSLADSINAAYAARNTTVEVNSKLESVKDTVKPKKFSR